MQIRHVALTCTSLDNADRFYGQILGLEKQKTKTLTRDLSQAVFGISNEITIVNYLGTYLHFEIFITKQRQYAESRIDHVCLAVDDREAFINACESYHVTIKRIPKGEKILFFIEDFDGNLFEIQSE